MSIAVRSVITRDTIGAHGSNGDGVIGRSRSGLGGSLELIVLAFRIRVLAGHRGGAVCPEYSAAYSTAVALAAVAPVPRTGLILVGVVAIAIGNRKGIPLTIHVPAVPHAGVDVQDEGPTPMDDFWQAVKVVPRYVQDFIAPRPIKNVFGEGFKSVVLELDDRKIPGVLESSIRKQRRELVAVDKHGRRPCSDEHALEQIRRQTLEIVFGHVKIDYGQPPHIVKEVG